MGLSFIEGPEKNELRRSTSRAIMEMQRRAKAYPVVAVDAAA